MRHYQHIDKIHPGMFEAWNIIHLPLSINPWERMAREQKEENSGEQVHGLYCLLPFFWQRQSDWQFHVLPASWTGGSNYYPNKQKFMTIILNPWGLRQLSRAGLFRKFSRVLELGFYRGANLATAFMTIIQVLFLCYVIPKCCSPQIFSTLPKQSWQP